MIDVLTHENRPRMAGADERLQGRCGPGRVAVPAALRRQDPVQRPADRAGGRRGAGDRALRGVAGPRGIRSGSARHGPVSCARRRFRGGSAGRSRREPVRAAESRAATPRRPWPRPRCATRANITSRSSITTRWSCLPRRWSSSRTASSRSTTRRRACRTSSAMSAACSRWNRTRCASCRPSWAAGSVRGCARNTRWSWRRWRRARCSARCGSC